VSALIIRVLQESLNIVVFDVGEFGNVELVADVTHYVSKRFKKSDFFQKSDF
jgi:hypothetical protein